MGIRHLNRFLKDNAGDAIKFISIAELSGKKVAVDVSIYMYKYTSDGNLIENIYLMLAVFRYYNVIPIFIFDGKPPAEKKELLIKRREDRKEAEDEYNKLKNVLYDNTNMDEIEKQELINNMDMLKRKFVHISKKDIENVKKLIRSYGATYYDAPGEADELCALLTIKGKVWACLSEDMDMFVYGCPRVIRYLSLLNHTVVLYDMKNILENLTMSQKELREICILSGTDYNSLHDDTKNIPTLDATLKQFNKYRKEKTNDKTNSHFYDWLIEKTDYIKDYDMLLKIYDMFDLNKNHYNIKVFENIKIINGPIQKSDIYDILKTDGFIFPVKKIKCGAKYDSKV
jgi:flap endonuclease-1